MSRDRIRCAIDALKCELDAFALSFGCHTRIELPRALDRAELRLAVCGARHAFARHAGVELERQPADLRAQLAVERRERFLESALTYVAPGADDVRHDLDLELLVHAHFLKGNYRFFAGTVQR